jgi:hypothetical protein
MTAIICRDIGIVCFIVFSVYGLLGTLRVLRTATAPLGPRPWALFGVFEVLEAVQVYGLVVPRPGADVRGGAIVALAVLIFCVYLQRLYFVSVRDKLRTFPRAPFYIGIVALLVVVLAAHLAAPYLP